MNLMEFEKMLGKKENGPKKVEGRKRKKRDDRLLISKLKRNKKLELTNQKSRQLTFYFNLMQIKFRKKIFLML